MKPFVLIPQPGHRSKKTSHVTLGSTTNPKLHLHINQLKPNMCLSFSFSPTTQTRFWYEAIFSFEHHLISWWTAGRREGRATGLSHYPEDNWFIKQNYNGLCRGTHTNDLNLSSFSVPLQKRLFARRVCLCVCADLGDGCNMNLCNVKYGRVLLMSSSGCPAMKYALQMSICKMVRTFT